MFTSAYKIAAKFTKPVIISTRTYDGSVKCGCGAFIELNDDGWIITVAHLLEPHFLKEQHSERIAALNDRANAIQNNAALDTNAKAKRTLALQPDPKWITDVSYWWGADGVKIDEFVCDLACDIAVGRIKNYTQKPLNYYPKFKDPTKFNYGRSLCRFGFPFHEIEGDFDDKKGFILKDGAIPVPFFPIEGIYTRDIHLIRTIDGKKRTCKFLETSSPGLRGQSGGPIVDIRGAIWGMQSKTQHYELGFSPIVQIK